MVSVYRAALLLKVMMSTNAQSALKKEMCSPRRVDRAWLFLTHHDLLSLFEVSSQVSLKPLARQMLERSRFPKRGHCQQKKRKDHVDLETRAAVSLASKESRATWKWKPTWNQKYPFPPIHGKHL